MAYIVLILTLDLLGGEVAHKQYYFNIRFIGREIGREVAYIFLILTLDIFVERQGGGIHRSPNSNFT